MDQVENVPQVGTPPTPAFEIIGGYADGPPSRVFGAYAIMSEFSSSCDTPNRDFGIAWYDITWDIRALELMLNEMVCAVAAKSVAKDKYDQTLLIYGTGLAVAMAAKESKTSEPYGPRQFLNSERHLKIALKE
ncbi:hypothetical protein BP5796_02896 [Coleophoma crateriformis]|uniref:Uncharacterized protein n=1 Tax=Coleophoma crateriformis TaxID=565419 RepID=A0A3D8SZX9_9HELO|nr:hypothetical protein BP5796_02896 [Coleophoma crateriformis]